MSIVNDSFSWVHASVDMKTCLPFSYVPDWDIVAYSVRTAFPKPDRLSQTLALERQCRENLKLTLEKIEKLKLSIPEVRHSIYWVKRILHERRLLSYGGYHEEYYRQIARDSENELRNKSLILKKMKSRLHRYKKYSRHLSRRLKTLEVETLLLM